MRIINSYIGQNGIRIILIAFMSACFIFLDKIQDWIDERRTEQQTKELAKLREYDSILVQENGYFLLLKNQRWGLADKDGDILINNIYHNVKEYSYSCLIAQKAQKWGVINKKNQIIMPFEYEQLERFNAKHILAKNQYGYGIYDNKGNKILAPQYDSIIVNRNTCFTVIKNHKQGISDEHGKIIIPIEYDSVGFVWGGLVPVARGGKWGLVNKKNQLVLDISYNQVQALNQGFFWVSCDKKYGFWRRGKVDSPLPFDSLIIHGKPISWYEHIDGYISREKFVFGFNAEPLDNDFCR